MAQPPRANSSINLKTLPLRPEEAFVYSRADGHTLPCDIALSTGLTIDQVEKALRRLGELGALDGVNPIAAPVGASAAPASTAGGFVPVPDLDITTEEQRRVWRLWSQLEQSNYYQLLGVSRTATREQVKAAYFDRVAAFHPDRHFKKTLGTYKEKFEAIFQRLTLAHDTLSRTRRREEYDAGLAPDAPGGGSDVIDSPSSRNGEKPPANGAGAVRQRAADEAPDSRPDIQRRSPTPDPQPRPAPPNGAVPDAAPTLPSRGDGSAPPISADPRREFARRALERGLRRGHSGEHPFPKPSNPALLSPSAAPPSSRSRALDQARSAENHGDWQVAGTVYEQLASTERDVALFNKAAECLERAARAAPDDPSRLWRRAVESARQAVQLAPEDVHTKLQLSRLYVGAGMRASAVREAERAQELSPSDKSVQSWLERLRRGDV